MEKAVEVLGKVRAATGSASLTTSGGRFEESSVTVTAPLGSEAGEDLVRSLMAIADAEGLDFIVSGAPEGRVVARFTDGRPKFHGN